LNQVKRRKKRNPMNDILLYSLIALISLSSTATVLKYEEKPTSWTYRTGRNMQDTVRTVLSLPGLAAIGLFSGVTAFCKATYKSAVQV